MPEKFVYKRLNDLLTNIVKDLNACGAMIFDTYGLPIVKYISSDKEDVEQLLKFITWAIITLDNLVFNSIGQHKKTLIIDVMNEKVVIRQITNTRLSGYLSIATPIEVPIGIILFESEFIEREINKLVAGESKITNTQCKYGSNQGIKDLLDKIEKHPLFKLLNSIGKENE